MDFRLVGSKGFSGGVFFRYVPGSGTRRKILDQREKVNNTPQEGS